MKFASLETGLIVEIYIGIAMFFMGLRAIVWQFLLKLVDLSIVYPFASLVQILVLVYAVLIFNEVVTIFNIIGLFLMLCGVFYMSRGVHS
jgi:small multidrug resistance pump